MWPDAHRLLVQWLEHTITATSLASNTSVVKPLRTVLHLFILLGTEIIKFSTFKETHSLSISKIPLMSSLDEI
jgi:hypothetical protein